MHCHRVWEKALVCDYTRACVRAASSNPFSISEALSPLRPADLRSLAILVVSIELLHQGDGSYARNVLRQLPRASEQEFQ